MNRLSPKKFEPHNKTKLSDNIYKIAAGGKQAGEFTEVMQYLLTYIQRTYVHGGDIQKVLDDKAEFVLVLSCLREVDQQMRMQI